MEAFFQWLGSLYVVPTIVALKEKAGAIKNAEVRRACNRLGQLTPREQKIITSMATAIVNQLLHDAIVNLKAAALTPRGHLYVEALQELFELRVDHTLPGPDMAVSVEGGRKY